MNQLEEAKKIYRRYLEEGLKMVPPFKGYGYQLFQFSIDYPELFRILFLDCSYQNFDEYLDERAECKKFLPAIIQTFGVNEQEARWLLKNCFIYMIGMYSFSQKKTMPISIEQSMTNFGKLMRGLLMQLKAQDDEREQMIPKKDLVIKGDLQEYIEGKKKIVIGYGDEKEVYQIQLDQILYFEAVGDKVFAYTKKHVFEVKKRLYQIEEMTKEYNYIRISKSMVIHINKIQSISSISGGRGSIQLTNGETVIASRNYYRYVLTKIKQIA